MTANSVSMVEFGRNLKEFIEIRQYCHYTRNRQSWVLSEQVGDQGLKRSLEGSDDD